MQKQSKKLGVQICRMFGDLATQPVTADKPNLKQDLQWAEQQDGFKAELKWVEERYREFLHDPNEAKLHAFVNFMQRNSRDCPNHLNN